MSERFRIAQVTPYAWEDRGDVNVYVDRLSAELVERGHRVSILAPSDSRRRVRESRQLVRKAADKTDLLFANEGTEVLLVGQSLPLSFGRRSGRRTLPIDISRTVEQVLALGKFDFVHVHEPFAPGVSSTALRHSRSLNIGSFHWPSERILSTQVARRVVRLFFGRLDARTATYQVTSDLVSSFFPAHYRVVAPGADVVQQKGASSAPKSNFEILFSAGEERAALRTFLRALRTLESDPDWHATVWANRPNEVALRVARTLRERITLLGPDKSSLGEALATAQIFCACSNGTAPAPQSLLRARVQGATCIASRLALYEELLDYGDAGLLFEPNDVTTLAAQLGRVIHDVKLRQTLSRAAERARFSWSQTADEFEQIYAEVAGRRHDSSKRRTASKRLAKRKLIHVDLHMHTDHSPDCATPVEVLLRTAKERGLGAIAVTDHNEISGALVAREKAEDIKVIVGEEIKTADQGEVIGLFLEHKIRRGMSLRETIDAIRQQGGLVYVPHPFDRLHSVPDYEHLLAVVGDIDIIEVFNPRIAIPSFNEEAARFATKYRIVPAAGSDGHVAQALGSVKISMRDFDGPQEFLESLRDADIVRRQKNLVYVQALKFLQTTGRPKPARRAAKAKGIQRSRRRPTQSQRKK